MDFSHFTVNELKMYRYICYFPYKKLTKKKRSVQGLEPGQS